MPPRSRRRPTVPARSNRKPGDSAIRSPALSAAAEEAARGANWFGYCDDNPTNKVDADGKEPLTLGAIFLILLFVAVTGALFGLGFYLGKTAVQGGTPTLKDSLWAMAEGAVGGLAMLGLCALFGMGIGEVATISAFVGVALLGLSAGMLLGMVFGGLEGKPEALATPAVGATAAYNAVVAMEVALCDAS